jgi:selenocysteine lyase/cysteine desulfurase
LFSAGNFVRLSNALYNTPEDFERLRDAVAELIVEQQTS